MLHPSPGVFLEICLCYTSVTKTSLYLNDSTAVQWWRRKKNHARCVPNSINNVIIIMTYQWKFQTFLQSSEMVFASFWVGYIAAYKLWRYCFHSRVPTLIQQLKWYLASTKVVSVFTVYLSYMKLCLCRMPYQAQGEQNSHLKILALLKFRFLSFCYLRNW